MVDISHESLMRIWVRLKNWVDDEADAVQMYLRLAEAATQYQVGKAGLWRPPDLQLALNWQAKHRPTLVWGQRYNPAFERTMIFLEYSKKEWETEQRIKELEQKRRLERARTTALVFGILAIVALIAFVYAFFQQTAANRARIQAQENEKVAIEQRALADKNAALAKAEAERANKEAEAARIANEQAQIARKDAEEKRLQAEANLVRAVKAEADAKAQAEIARQRQREAEVAQRAAERAEAEANRQRYIAQAKAMAVKSKELDSDPTQEALIAQQAYKFNSKYGGNAYDNDVYNGLYTALNHEDINDPLTKNLEGHNKGAARALVTRVKSNEIYSGGSDGRILRWTKKNGYWSPDSIMNGRSTYQVYALDLSPDGNTLVAGGATTGDITQNYIEVYDLRSPGSAPKKVLGFSGVETLIYAQKENGVYVRDQAGMSIKFTDFNTVKEVIKPKEKIHTIAMSTDGTRLAGAGKSGALYIWDISNNYAERVAFKNSSDITSVTFAPNNQQIIFGDEEGQVKILQENSNLAPRILTGHLAHIEQIVFNNAGTFLATTSRDHTARLWNWSKISDPPIVLKDQDEWVWSAAFTPDDEQLMVGVHGSGGEKSKETIHVWPVDMTAMSNLLCSYVGRNMTNEEWVNNVGPDLKYEKTCENYPANNK